MKKYSQRDSRWANIKLGTSDKTIGSHGCTITSLSMLLTHYGHDETPSTVNKKLRDNGGYLYGNLLIWSKINELWHDIEWEWRGYDNDEARINNNLPCIIQVKNKTHWVLKISKNEVVDPWTGRINKFDKYSVDGYAIIKYTGEAEKTDLERCLDQHKTLMDKIRLLEEELTNEKEKTDKWKSKAERYKEERNHFAEELAGIEDEVDKQKEVIKGIRKTVSQKDEEIEETKEGFQKYQLTLADIFQCKVDEVVANAKTLISRESKWLEIERDYKKQYDQLKADKKAEIESLRGEIESLKSETFKLQKQVSTLEQRLEDVEYQEETRISPIMELFKKLFWRKQ